MPVIYWGNSTIVVEREASGSLPAFVWPGGYPVIYHTRDGDTVCPECAGKEDTSDPAVCAVPHWEGPPETCVDCHAEIASAYGGPGPDDDGKADPGTGDAAYATLEASPQGEAAMSDTWTLPVPVSEQQAREVLELVITHFHKWTHDDNGQRRDAASLPTLTPPNNGHGPNWSIWWESGAIPSEWPARFTLGGYCDRVHVQFTPAALPDGVLCEPVDGCRLGISQPHAFDGLVW